MHLNGAVTITLDEGQRQAMLLALGHLAAARPGWHKMLAEIAVKCDNIDQNGPMLYNDYRNQAQTEIIATSSIEFQELHSLRAEIAALKEELARPFPYIRDL